MFKIKSEKTELWGMMCELKYLNEWLHTLKSDGLEDYPDLDDEIIAAENKIAVLNQLLYN